MAEKMSFTFRIIFVSLHNYTSLNMFHNHVYMKYAECLTKEKPIKDTI